MVPTRIATGTRVTVTEATPTSPITDGDTTYTLSATPAPVTITIVEGTQTAAQAASFTNTYTSTTATGTLVINKTVTGYTLTSNYTYTFNVYEGTDNTGRLVGTVDVLVRAGEATGSGSISGLTFGTTYYVEETNGTISGYTLVTTGDKTTFTCTSAAPEKTIDVTNAYTQQGPTTGTLVINKTVTGYTLTSNYTYTFNVYEGTDNTGRLVGTVDVLVRAGEATGSGSISGLTFGTTYYVEETNGTISGYTLVTTGDKTTFTCTSAAPEKTIDVTNAYSVTPGPGPSVGDLVIRKTISGTELNNLETITFSITGPQQLSVPSLCFANVGVGADQWHLAGVGIYEFTFTGVAAGDYSVTEILDGSTSNYVLNPASSTTSGSAAVSAGGTGLVILSDSYVESTTPTEPTEPTTPTETSSEDTSPAAPATGCLIISKTISGTALNELETITFVLTDTNCGATRDVPALTVENVANGLWGDAGNGTYYYIVTDLTPGVTYSVVESLDGHTTTYSLDVANSITSGTAVVVANDTVTVTLSDAYTTDGSTTTSETSDGETVPTGDETTETTAPEVVSVTLDGQPLDEDSYTVNPDGSITINEAIRRTLGSGSHTVVVTYVNGANRTFTFYIEDADSRIGSTGESSVNVAAAVILFSAMACAFVSVRLRKEEE